MMVGAKEITIAGLWTFAIIALVGGLYGKLDGFALFMFFILAMVISLGLIVLPASGQKNPQVESNN